MGHKEKVKACLRIKKWGWYAVRQNMIKQGATIYDVSEVLCWWLRIQSS